MSKRKPYDYTRAIKRAYVKGREDSLAGTGPEFVYSAPIRFVLRKLVRDAVRQIYPLVSQGHSLADAGRIIARKLVP